jgi:hypothetical protein
LVNIQFEWIVYPGAWGQAIAAFQPNPFRQIQEVFAPVTRLPLQPYKRPGKENGVLTAARADFQHPGAWR